MVDQHNPDAFFYFWLIATGGTALAFGYASGLRLNVVALLMICIASGVAVLLAALGFGSSASAGIVFALVAMISLQFGYFAAVLVRGRASTAASSKRAVEPEVRAAINPGKRSAR